MKTFCCAAVVLSLVVCSHGQASGEIELFAQDTGWYDAAGFHNPSNVNYVVGDALGTNFHNFSVFDLSSITAPIVSARLLLFNGASPPNTADGYISPDPFETYAFFDVTTDIGVLTGGTGGVGAYDDLGGGTFYGSYDVSSADNGAFVIVDLNSDAIAALNSAGGKFAFGGAITTISHPLDVQESAFWFSHESPDVRLIVTIPAPGTIALLATFGLGAIRRRRRC